MAASRFEQPPGARDDRHVDHPAIQRERRPSARLGRDIFLDYPARIVHFGCIRGVFLVDDLTCPGWMQPAPMKPKRREPRTMAWKAGQSPEPARLAVKPSADRANRADIIVL